MRERERERDRERGRERNTVRLTVRRDKQKMEPYGEEKGETSQDYFEKMALTFPSWQREIMMSDKVCVRLRGFTQERDGESKRERERARE